MEETDKYHPQISSSTTTNKEKDISSAFVPCDAHGIAALIIGQTISNNKKRGNTQIYYYGSAHPNNIPLATVRRERTPFFQSGGLEKKVQTKEDNDNNNKANIPDYGICTIGSPPNFVENVNIRTTSKCTKQMAQSLTKKVRARDGGIVGVEALTLPYSNDRFEVACNLLSPQLGSKSMIEEEVAAWIKDYEQQQEQVVSAEIHQNNHERMIEGVYRVGTTAEQ
eukprot:9016760-Ditylum_brightwellii.AAC.1